jgi:hypothetical protein
MLIRVNKKTGKKEEVSYEVFKKEYAEQRNNQIKKDVVKALQKNYKKLDDSGHAIIPPSFYVNKIGLPEEYVYQFSCKHYSKYNDYKTTLYDQNNNVIDYIFGVYNLDILKSLCFLIGWNKDKKDLFFSLWGRGSQAEVCIENINLHFKK